MSDIASDDKFQSRIQKMQLLRNDNPRLDTPENIIRKAVERKYPRLNFEDSRKIVNDLVTKPTSEKIKIGNEEVRIDDLTEYVADNIELINAGSSEYGASSLGEYFGWIEEAQSVIKHMNDGEVTPQDLDDKHNLLTNFQQREVDLMVCISLYRRCNLENPRIKQKYDELNKKLLRLREIRSAIENSTKDRVDEKKIEDNDKSPEFLKATLYLHFLALLHNEIQENRQIVSEEDRRKLNVYSSSFVNTPYIWNNIKRNSMPQQASYRESLAEKFVESKPEVHSREAIEHKLMILSGRIKAIPSESKNTMVNVRERAFDINRYMQLKKLQEAQTNLHN